MGTECLESDQLNLQRGNIIKIIKIRLNCSQAVFLVLLSSHAHYNTVAIV